MAGLFEYVLHPMNALKKVYNYHRDPDVRRVSRDVDGRENRRRAMNWMTEYFASLYELNRIELYAMYREMDQDPLVSSVLDTCAMIASQPNSEGGSEDAGRSVWVHSNNKKIQKILMNFLDSIRMEEGVFPILRSLLLYGDHYESMPGTRNDGIVRLDPYHPWEIAVLRDCEGRISGYGESDSQGEVTNPDSVMPFYRMAHFKMPFRFRTDVYGVNSSLLYNSRDYWVELQWCMDKVWIERQQRRPPRLAILMDVGGASTEDAYDTCKEWEERLYRDIYYNPQDGVLKQGPNAWGEQRDVVLPTGGDNRTQITQLAGSTSMGSLDDLNFFLRRFFGCLKFPPGYLGLDIGDTYDRATPIEKQDIAFAQACMRPQKAFLTELTRVCMVHLAYHNIDPRNEENRFLLQMTPVSTFAEIERKELIAMRFDLMDRALQLGSDHQWNQEVWDRYVMTEYARLPEDFVEELLKTGVDEPVESKGYSNRRRSLMERLKENPRAHEALLFFREGCSQSASGTVPFDLTEATLQQTMDWKVDIRFSNSEFTRILKERGAKKARARAARMVLNA